MLNSKHPLSAKGTISLVLGYAPLGLVRALKAEIGPDRILVDTGCVTLSDHSDVDIVLSIREGERHATHRIRARVTGQDGGNFRLDFRECSGATLKALIPYFTLH